VREKCKIILSWDDVRKEMQETLCGFIKECYIFPSKHEKIGKNAMMKIISNALRRFKHALNKYYMQMGLSPLNWFGYIMPDEWDTFIQQHTTPQVVALSNKMKELNAKNKFRHKLGLEGTRLQCQKGQRKSKSFVMLEYKIPLKVALCAPETGSEVILIQMIADD
jgi:hypothetical protein